METSLVYKKPIQNIFQTLVRILTENTVNAGSITAKKLPLNKPCKLLKFPNHIKNMKFESQYLLCFMLTGEDDDFLNRKIGQPSFCLVSL